MYKIKAELDRNNYIINEEIVKNADSIIDEIFSKIVFFGNKNEDEILHTPINKSSYKNTFVIQEPESVKIWNWGEIIFWTIIICSIGILTPVAFFYRRLIRGFSIIVKNNE